MMRGLAKEVAGTAGVAACAGATFVIIADDSTVILAIDDVLLPFAVMGAIKSGAYAIEGGIEFGEGVQEFANGISSALANISFAKKHHEDATYGKIKNKLEQKLGRGLNQEEREKWRKEIEHQTEQKVKSGDAAKREKNPSLTEDELKEAALDAGLDV